MGKLAGSSLIESLVALVVITLVLIATSTAYLFLVGQTWYQRDVHLNLEVAPSEIGDEIEQFEISKKVRILRFPSEIGSGEMKMDFLNLRKE